MYCACRLHVLNGRPRAFNACSFQSARFWILALRRMFTPRCYAAASQLRNSRRHENHLRTRCPTYNLPYDQTSQTTQHHLPLHLSSSISILDIHVWPGQGNLTESCEQSPASVRSLSRPLTTHTAAFALYQQHATPQSHSHIHNGQPHRRHAIQHHPLSRPRHQSRRSRQRQRDQAVQ